MEVVVMYLIFVDECGYNRNWLNENAIQQQPFYVVSGVAILDSDLGVIYRTLRENIENLYLRDIEAEKLGKGEEIKAKEVDKNEGIWRNNNRVSEKVRRIYLDHQTLTYFIVCIDKRKHKDSYRERAYEPSTYALQLLFERFQMFLKSKNQYAFVLIDFNSEQKAVQQETLAELQIRGSCGITGGFFENVYEIYQWRLPMNNIVEIHFGDSKYSLGLQIADFVARHAYSYLKNNRDSRYPGWSFIESRLYNYPDYQGYGYKEFP